MSTAWTNKARQTIRRYAHRRILPSTVPAALLALCFSTHGSAAFQITSPSTVTAPAGGPFTYQITTSSPSSSYIAGGYPPWLTFDQTTGLLSGIAPKTPGVFTTTISASDGAAAATITLTLNIARLTPLDILAHQQFGARVAVSGNTAVVGSVDPDTSEVLASVYVDQGNGWVHEAVLRCEQSYEASAANWSIAISGNTAVIGCEQVFELGEVGYAGGVFVFERTQTPNGPAWTQTALLRRPDYALSSVFDTFGSSVAISGNTIVVGAPRGGGVDVWDDIRDETGVAHVFVRTPSSGSTNWGHAKVLRATNAEYEDYFGGSVAISGNTIVVGAPGEDGAGNVSLNSGSAYVFVGGGGVWTQQAYLRASNADGGDGFGSSVGVSVDTVVVGSPGEDSSATGVNGNQMDNSVTEAGAAYVFQRSGTTWSQQAYLKRENPADNWEKRGFGRNIALDGETVAIHDHIFWRKGTFWTYKERLSGTDAGATPIAVGGETVIQGGYDEEALLFYNSPRGPVVFIHGIAGSVLKNGSYTIWPTILPPDVADLNLATGPAGVEAVDTVREFAGSKFYGPFLEDMVLTRGYREFQMQEDRRRMTNSHIATLAGANKPDLFVFPYDWRKPNAGHTATLHAYLQNISSLHNGAKVNLVVHSMGGLVMRRYMLDYGAGLIGRVVTVASPIWGAPESAYRMFTGCFFPYAALDYLNSATMKKSVLSMPAVHELNPSTLFLQNWGLPVFTESGFDYNLNGLKQEGYDSVQFRVLLDEEAYPQTPAINNISFHGYRGGRQDDWSADTNNVEFLHIVGRQAVDRTPIRINVRPKTVFQIVTSGSVVAGLVKGYGVFERVYGEGDGTVPLLSAKRTPAYYAPNTQVREINEPLADKLSDDQPAGQGAEHTSIMANATVWNLINSFLETGTAPPVPVPAGPRRRNASIPTVTAAASAITSVGTPLLRITEIMSALNSGSGSTPYTPDWIEVTNYGSSSADLTGYRVRDTLSFTVPLNGVTSIAPGESVVFVKTANPNADIPAFRAVWGLSDSVRVGSYDGPVLGADQDSAVLLTQSGTEIARADYHAGTKNRSFTFVHRASGQLVAMASPASAIGEFGAYSSSGSPADVGSPGYAPPLATRLALVQTVPVGDAGNAADTNGFGKVDQDYRIGKFEVTIGQYTAFLNSVAKADPYGLYSTSMAVDLNEAGISRSGTSGTFSYAVTGPSGWKPVGASSPANRPIVNVSWFDMARFCNWLHNGATNGADTETGAYTLGGATNGAAPASNNGAKWRLPTENEWYKAAYYKAGGTNTGYWPYATRNTNRPNNNMSTRSTGNQANIYTVTTGSGFNSRFTVSGSTAYETNQNYLTEAGAFNNSDSAYGTFDQSGNVFELNDLSGLASTNRGLRGGGCYYNETWAISSYRWGETPTTYQSYTTGFRVATIARPEPSLNGLILSDGAMTPAFAPQTQSYAAAVPHAVSSVSVTPATADADASITVNGLPVTSGEAGPALSLNVGTNAINVVVTAADGITSKAYRLLVTRAPSADASLASLVLSSGTLSPDFSGETTGYASSVPYTVDSLTVTPTPSESTASVRVNGSPLASGSPSDDIDLSIGANTITIEVTAPDGTSRKTYTVAVTRSEPIGRKQILVTGCGYVSIRDAQTGADNALLSEIAAKRVPGVDVVYNEEAGWTLIEFAADQHIVIGSVPGKRAAEVEIMTISAAGAVLDIQRYRSVSGSASWQATVAPNQPASLAIDSNNDGTFAPGEQVTPDFSASGPSIDMDPPDVQLVLSLVGNQLQLAATGADTSGYGIRYQIDGGPLTTYSGPVLFPRDSQAQIALFAEDALGNTSGVINTRLNPQLSLQAGPASSFTVEWLEAEGYRLQTAETLEGPWSEVSVPQVLSNGRMSATVTPPPGTKKAFYRLIAHPVAK